MKKIGALLIASSLCLFILSGCAVVGCVTLGAMGALIDKKDPKRGAALGCAAGLMIGITAQEMSDKAVKEAARKNEPVAYKNDKGQMVVAVPIKEDGRRKCKKIQSTTIENDKVVSKTEHEVCESEKIVKEY